MKGKNSFLKKSSRVKVPYSSLDCIWDAYLGEKRQLSGKISIFYEAFGSLMLFFLTLNVEP